MRGNRLFNSVADSIFVPAFTKFPGIRAQDLFNPAGIDLTLPASGVYPYIPGISNPANQIFTLPSNGNELIQDFVTSINVLLIYSGGSLDGNSSVSRTERDYQQTGAKLRKKLK